MNLLTQLFLVLAIIGGGLALWTSSKSGKKWLDNH